MQRAWPFAFEQARRSFPLRHCHRAWLKYGFFLKAPEKGLVKGKRVHMDGASHPTCDGKQDKTCEIRSGKREILHQGYQ